MRWAVVSGELLGDVAAPKPDQVPGPQWGILLEVVFTREPSLMTPGFYPISQVELVRVV